ncbi:hypothetical protein H6A11_00310 [Bifidobacterium pullorum subsp. saeculare]|uniref:hypothetical protein n=1 Tax=Bifidobacterium pullorum TaxID=78448 RepID=UPI001959932B|nr:hypothetical protein [Bifidobacterium pullorum]MBM6695498.1 hypothetical protein [Bifidobacterium pullorum subsp. saeculare]
MNVTCQQTNAWVVSATPNPQIAANVSFAVRVVNRSPIRSQTCHPACSHTTKNTTSHTSGSHAAPVNTPKASPTAKNAGNVHNIAFRARRAERVITPPARSPPAASRCIAISQYTANATASSRHSAETMTN